MRVGSSVGRFAASWRRSGPAPSCQAPSGRGWCSSRAASPRRGPSPRRASPRAPGRAARRGCESRRTRRRVLPGRAGLDVARGGLREATPVAQGVGGQLGAVVAANVLGRRTPGGDEPVEDGDRLIGVDAPAALNGSASRVCSSTMCRSFKSRPSAVWSNSKSSAQTWLGCSACKRLAGTVDSPMRWRFRRRLGTLRPSSRHRRPTHLRFRPHPSSRRLHGRGRYGTVGGRVGPL